MAAATCIGWRENWLVQAMPNLRPNLRWLAALAAAVVVLAPAGARAGMFFPLRFDISPDDGKIDPYPYYRGGHGYLSIDDDLPDGRYRIDSLTNMVFAFSIASSKWSSNDYVLYSPTAEMVIYGSGSSFYFDGPPADGVIWGAFRCQRCSIILASQAAFLWGHPRSSSLSQYL